MALFPTAKLQNLKAIHNFFAASKKSVAVVSNRKITKSESNSQQVGYTTTPEAVVSNRKITKSESNSQPLMLKVNRLYGCFQPQNYKI